MATPVLQINHNTVPNAEPYLMGTGGRTIPHPPATVRQNGLGNDVLAGYASFEWTWSALLISDMNWWNTILLGQPSFTFNHAYLYDHTGALVTYTNACLHRPTFEYFEGNTVFNVKVVIDQLL